MDGNWDRNLANFKETLEDVFDPSKVKTVFFKPLKDLLTFFIEGICPKFAICAIVLRIYTF